jgi:hypothetical protein
MADNPISWFFLMVIGLYFVYRFLRAAYLEYEERRKEREDYVNQEIFLQNSIDKSNTIAYNRYINKGGNTNEHYDARL